MEKDQEDQSKEQEAQDNSTGLETKPVEELITIIKETRSEAKQRRLAEKSLAEKIESLQKEIDEAKEAKMKEEGNKDGLIKTLEEKLNSRNSEFEKAKSKAEQFEQYETAKRKAIKKQFGEKWKESFSKFTLDELEELAEDIIKESKVPTDSSNSFYRKNGKDKSTEEKLMGIYKQ